jgi:hypothetical protein
MAGAGGDLLLATGAYVCLARLRRMDTPHVEPKRFARSGQVGDLLQLLDL